MKNKRFSHRDLIVALLLGVISTLIFFRVQITTNFGIVFGDRSDGMIEIAHLEHWTNVFSEPF